MKNQIIPIYLALLIIFTAGHAQALTISHIDGIWTGTDGGSYITYGSVSDTYGTKLENQVRWGISTGSGQSGFGFTGATPPSAIFDFNDVFEIGQLKHYNEPLSVGSAASKAFLSVNLQFSDPAGFAPIFNFAFSIDETLNSPGPPESDDHIGIYTPVAHEIFDHAGIDYSFELIGFGTSYDNLINSFSSPEDGTNSTLLWGKITKQRPAAVPVSEPATILLFSTGLVSITGYSRRKKK